MAAALVIDDHRETADNLCRLLGLLGVEARPAYGARAAMIMVAEFIPRVIFLDINLPGVDGFEVLAYLRRRAELEAVPVIVFTVEADLETRQRAEQAGARLVLAKPVTFESLAAALRQVDILAE